MPLHTTNRHHKATALFIRLKQLYYLLRAKRWFSPVRSSILGILITLLIINLPGILILLFPGSLLTGSIVDLLTPARRYVLAGLFAFCYFLWFVLRPLGRDSRWFYILWSSLLSLAAGIILARVIIYSESWKEVVVPVIGLLFFALIARRLDYGLIMLLTLTSSIFYDSVIPKPLPVEGMGFGLAEMMLILLLGVTVFRSGAERKLDWLISPMTLPMLLFCAAILLSMYVSVRNNQISPDPTWSFKNVYNVARPSFFYLLFFVAAFGISTERQLKTIIAGLVVIASIVGILMAIQYQLGTDTRIFMGTPWSGPRIESLSSEESDVTRTLPPGMALMLNLFPAALALSCLGNRRNRIRYGIAALLIGMGLVFTFTRVYWLATILGILVIIAFAGKTIRKRIIISLVIAVPSVILLSMAAGKLAPGQAGADFTTALTNRFTSMFQRKMISDPTIQSRLYEIRAGIRRAKEDPVFGVGVGNPVIYAKYAIPGTGIRGIAPHYQIHNGYLELLLVYGSLGVISFVWLSIAFVIRSFQVIISAPNPFYRALAVSFLAAYLGFLLRSATTLCLLDEPYNIAAIGFVLGAVEALWRIGVRGEQKFEDTALDARTYPAKNTQGALALE